MLKILAFLTKRQDLATKAFPEHYETKHIPLIRSLAPTPPVYKRSYLGRGDALNHHDGSIDVDVATEFVFADREATRLGRSPSSRCAPASGSSPTKRGSSGRARKPSSSSAHPVSTGQDEDRTSICVIESAVAGEVCIGHTAAPVMRK
jgi:EthD domain